MSEHNVRVDQLLHYIREGKLLEAMSEFYADNVTMEEPARGATRGLEANLERERQFVGTLREITNFQVPRLATGPNTAMYETIMDWVSTDGTDHHLEQVTVQTWKNGKIIHERFYYAS